MVTFVVQYGKPFIGMAAMIAGGKSTIHNIEQKDWGY
jgi:hypothetical protein